MKSRAILISSAAMIITAITVCVYPERCGAQQQATDTERLVRRLAPPVDIVKEVPVVRDQLYFDTFYEPSDILQGSRTGHWSELTETFGYNHKGIHAYGSLSQYNRFDDKDYAANLGTYINLHNSYIHYEIAYGWYADYMYNWQAIVDYGHKLYKTWFWQMAYTYREYDIGDTHMLYPGIIYYFGDSLMSANWGVSFIEGRDTAQFGAVRGDFAITEFLRFYTGIAFGERLYDIFGSDAHAENGFILFTGLNFRLYKGIYIRAGYSYSEEAPKFIKRSVSFGATLKF